MKKINLIVILFSVLFFASCDQSNEEAKNENQEEVIETTNNQFKKVEVDVTLEPKSGSSLSGVALFKQSENGTVTLELNVTGLTEGKHAVHIHEFGDCSSSDGKSAGGHWNPTQDDHGKWGHEHYHLGDIGNLKVYKDGSGHLTFITDKWSLNEGEENSILKKSIIIHAKADDFTSQPSGNAGSRVACGVIQ